MHTFGKKCHILIEYLILGMFANEHEWVIYITRETNPSHSEQKLTKSELKGYKDSALYIYSRTKRGSQIISNHV